MPEGCDQKLDVFPTILTFYPTPFPPQTIPLLVDTFYINHSLGRGPPPTHFETCKIHLFGLVEVLMWLVECFALALSCCHHQFYWVEREGGSTEKQLGIDLHSTHPCSP